MQKKPTPKKANTLLKKMYFTFHSSEYETYFRSGNVRFHSDGTMEIILDETDDEYGFKILGKKNSVGGFEGTSIEKSGKVSACWNIIRPDHYVGIWKGAEEELFEFIEDDDEDREVDEDYD